MSRNSPSMQIMPKGLRACLALVLLLSIGLGSVVRTSAFADDLSGRVSSAAYALPDGTMPVICRGVGDAAPEGDGHTVALHCFLCTFVKIAGLPPVPEMPAMHWQHNQRLVPVVAVTAPMATQSFSFLARGPPVRA